MQRTPIVISVNAAWNLVNFRLGLIRHLAKTGYQVIALAPPDGHEQQLRAAGIEFHPIAMDKKGISPLRDLSLAFQYYKMLKKLKPKVLLAYTIKPNIYGSVAARLLRIGVINNVSGLGTAFIKGGWLSHVVTGLYRIAFRRSQTVFFQNRDDRELFISKGLVRPDQARLLPGSGVDLEHFHPTGNESRTSEGFRFLLIARLIKDKGILEYVEAARLLRDRGADARFQLLGMVDAENRTAIRRETVERWAAEGLTEYLGETDDVRPFIAAADCVVLPSYREGLPRTLLEAAAMARPLIATDVPGCRDIVRDGVNGFLCAVRDPAALATAMEKMLGSSAGQRAAFGAAARAVVEAEFSESRVSAAYVDAIEAVLS